MKNSFCLALSGGGMRGCAHIGVLKKLEELKLHPKSISGTSIGAIIGAFAADGFLADEIIEIFIRSKFNFDLNFFRFSEALLSSKKMEMLLKKNLRSKRIENMKIPFHICVTNFRNGKVEYLSEGLLIKSILASSAIPFIYKSIRINNKTYVDGGLSENLPVSIFTSSKSPIIGVHVNPLSASHIKKSMLQKLDYLIHMSLLDKLEQAKKVCDIFIEPEKLVKYSFTDVNSISQMVSIGYKKTEEELTPNKVKLIFN